MAQIKRHAGSSIALLSTTTSTTFISYSHYSHRSVKFQGDAGSITRGTGHSRPCSPTKRIAWYQDRSPEVHPHVFCPQVFIFATCNPSHSSIVYTAAILPNEDSCRSILCLTYCTRSSWSDLNSSILPQCRTPRKVQRSSHSANILGSSEAGGWSSVGCLSPSEGAGFYPSFRLPGRIGDCTKLPLFSTPFPKHR